MTTKPPEEEVNTPAPAAVIAPVAAAIEAVQETITETPIEDKDKEWREKVSLTLDSLAATLDKLQKSQGQSPELTLLNQTLARLEERLASAPLIPPATPPPLASEGVAPLSPETPPVSQSEPPPSALPQAPPVKKKAGWL